MDERRMPGDTGRRTEPERRRKTRRPSGDRISGEGAAPKRTASRRTASERAASERMASERKTSGRTASGRRPAGSAGTRKAEERPVQRYRTQSGSRRTPSSRRPGRRRRVPKALLLALLVILLAAVAAGGFLWVRYGPSGERYDLNTYFSIESSDQVAVTVDNEVLGPVAREYDGRVYVTYETVRDYVNSRFYWDSNENLLLYTLPTGMVSASVGSPDYTVSRESRSMDYNIVRTEGSQAYIALDFIREYTDLEYQLYTDGGVNHVMIQTDWGETVTAEARRDTQVRLRGGVKSEILTDISRGDKVTVIEDEGDWKKIRTEDGFVGYVTRRSLRNEKTEEITSGRDFTEPEYTSIQKDYKINLAWHQVTNQSANSAVLETIASTKGLNTISPTWFSVADSAGNLTSIASSDYVNYAHQAGLEVWALVDNFSENVDDMELLSHTSSRVNLENQLISAALQNDIDGINVDFEQIQEEEGEHYIQFIRELSVMCRLNNLVLSVDNYVPMGFNEHYHRDEQGVMADYVIIMGYDEHYSGSYEAGSVASYDYVKNGIEETLKDVPAEKVINAVPLYTRLWREVPKTEEELASEAGTEAANYTTSVTSEALGMAEAAERVSSAGVEAVWDDTVKQNYAEWTGSDGATYKIWLEDTASLEAKLQLIQEYSLAGSAAWKLGFETSDVWDLIIKYVN